MKKIISSILIMTILLFLCIEILINSTKVMNSVIFSFDIWKSNIFPSLFPFFVISNLLIHYGFVEFVGELFKPIMQKLFKIKGEASFVFIMSMLSGFPSSAKYIKELLLNKTLSNEEATKLLMFTHFSNPLFIIGTIGITFLHNKRVGLLIILSHYLGNIIIGILVRNYHPSFSNTNRISIKNAIIKMNNKRINNKNSLGSIISKAITDSINTLLLVLGTISLFLILSTIINDTFSFSPITNTIISGLLEMTQGLKYISLLKISLRLKCAISCMIISFGGFSVHMQIKSIISETNIAYLPYFLSRIFHMIISFLLTIILYSFII